MSGRSADAKRLHEVAPAVVDPWNTTPHTPHTPQIPQTLQISQTSLLSQARALPDQSYARTLEGVILARLTAMDQFAQLPETLWAWARVFVLCGGSTQRPVYRRPSPSLSPSQAPPSSTPSPRANEQTLVFRQVIAPEDMETLQVSVCLEVLTVLGLGWVEPARSVTYPRCCVPRRGSRGDVQASIEVRAIRVPGSARQRAPQSTLHIGVTISTRASDSDPDMSPEVAIG